MELITHDCLFSHNDVDILYSPLVSGMDAFLGKPIRLELLVDALQTAFKYKTAQSQQPGDNSINNNTSPTTATATITLAATPTTSIEISGRKNMNSLVDPTTSYANNSTGATTATTIHHPNVSSTLDGLVVPAPMPKDVNATNIST